MPYRVVGNAEKESPCGCQPGGHGVSASLKGLAFVETEVGAPGRALWTWQGGGWAASLRHRGVWELVICAHQLPVGAQRPWHWPLDSRSSCDLSNLRTCADPLARLRMAGGRPVSGRGLFLDRLREVLNLSTNLCRIEIVVGA